MHSISFTLKENLDSSSEWELDFACARVAHCESDGSLPRFFFFPRCSALFDAAIPQRSNRCARTPVIPKDTSDHVTSRDARVSRSENNSFRSYSFFFIHRMLKCDVH